MMQFLVNYLFLDSKIREVPVRLFNVNWNVVWELKHKKIWVEYEINVNEIMLNLPNDAKVVLKFSGSQMRCRGTLFKVKIQNSFTVSVILMKTCCHFQEFAIHFLHESL